MIHTHTFAYQHREGPACFALVADQNTPLRTFNQLIALWGILLNFFSWDGLGVLFFGWGDGFLFLNGIPPALKFKAIFRLGQTFDFSNYCWDFLPPSPPPAPSTRRKLKLWFRYLVPAALPALSKWFHVTRCITISEWRRSVAANPLSPLISLGARSLKTDALVTNREKISTGGSWIGFNHLLITSNETYSGEEKKNR